MNRFMSAKWLGGSALLFVVLTDLMLTSIALADRGDRIYWVSESGQTSFTDPVQVACSSSEEGVFYQTSTGGIYYNGKISSLVSSCNSQDYNSIRQLDVIGNFEEVSLDGTEKCIGKMILLFDLPEGGFPQSDPPPGSATVMWRNIHAAPGFRCSGAGSKPELTLLPTLDRPSFRR